MSSITTEHLASAVRALFIEAFEGAEGDATWFVNMEPGSGIFGTIGGVSAERASQPVVEGGRSIAAHVEHLRWWLSNVNTVARGGQWNPDWSGSWSVQAVNPQQWDALRTQLRQEFDAVVEALDQGKIDWSDRMVLTGSLAMPAHAAHHLGTIRQIARVLRDRGGLPTSAD